MMKIIFRVLVVVLLLILWFCLCGWLWGKLFPLEMVYWLADQLNIYGDEAIYDLAANIGLSAACVGGIVLTTMTLRLMRRKGWIK
jgi:uncharacterized membrane protein